MARGFRTQCYRRGLKSILEIPLWGTSKIRCSLWTGDPGGSPQGNPRDTFQYPQHKALIITKSYPGCSPLGNLGIRSSL